MSLAKRLVSDMRILLLKNYRGEIGVILVNLSNTPQTIEPGERVAQLVVAKVEMAELEEVEKIPENIDRGEDAYGSSGRF